MNYSVKEVQRSGKRRKKERGGGHASVLHKSVNNSNVQGGLNVLTPARQKFKQTRPNVSGRGKQHMGKHAN